LYINYNATFALHVMLAPKIVDSMHLSKVDMVFRLLSLNQAYVTNSGRLVGLITRSLLWDYLGDKHRKRPTDRCWRFFVALCRACSLKKEEGLDASSSSSSSSGGGGAGGGGSSSRSSV
jgi:uncharacterized membrane protein YgcG